VLGVFERGNVPSGSLKDEFLSKMRGLLASQDKSLTNGVNKS
jgi:hypothetical protein